MEQSHPLFLSYLPTIQISRLDRTEELTVRLRIGKPEARLELHCGNDFAANGNGGLEFIKTEHGDSQAASALRPVPWVTSTPG